MAPNTPNDVLNRDFDAAWRDFFQQHPRLADLQFALTRLTNAGEVPVAVDQLADALTLSAEDTVRLVDRYLISGNLPSVGARIEDGYAYLVLETSNPKPRFVYHIGERAVGVGGCAPDAYFFAYGLQRSFHVESVCPVTATPVRVDFAADGVVAAEPESAVVAVIHPDTAPEAFGLTDGHTTDSQVCLQQPFFASADAAEEWRSTHPGGQVIPVADFYPYLRKLIV